MYRRGHWGVSLLAFAPVGALLVGAGRPTLAVVGGAAVCWLATLPDVDVRIPLVEHRGVTHTLAFALAVGAVGGATGYALGPVYGGDAVAAAGFGFAVGTFGILAHLLGDALTPAGVPLLWPLSGHSVTLSLVEADDAVANHLLLVMGVVATAAAAFVSVRI